MDISKRYRTDETAETEGIWRKLPDGGELKVARLGNPTYQRAYQRLERAWGAVDGTTMPDEQTAELVINAMAEGILLGWRDIEWEGETLPYSLENAKKALAVKDFRRVVLEFSRDWEQYRKERLEAAAKN